MEIIVAAVAVVVGAGCFLAIVAGDLHENKKLFSLRDTSWETQERNKHKQPDIDE